MNTLATETPFANRWNALRLKNNDAARWSAGNFTLYVQRILDDWIIAQSDESVEQCQSVNIQRVQSIPVHLEWKRWALGKDDNELRFWPAFPDRPLVLKTKAPVIIPTGSTVRFHIGLPIWLEVSVARGDAFMTLDRFGSNKLSSTWYGDHFEGELCYAIGSRARRSSEIEESSDPQNDDPLRAFCEFSIVNVSDEPLPVEKIRVHTNHLAIFAHQGRLHCNSINVTFHGKTEPSTARYDPTPKLPIGSYELIKASETPFKHGSLLDTLVFKNFRTH